MAQLLASDSFRNLLNILKSMQDEKPSVSLTTFQYIFRFSIKALVTITNLISRVDGRDRLCSLLQYFSKFYGACLIYSLSYESNSVVNELLFDKYDTCKRIEKAMASARKIFRFRKPIEDITKIYLMAQKPVSYKIILHCLIDLSGIFYHSFDNVLWLSNIGLIGEYIYEEIKWKNSKNFFSFIKNSIKLILYLIELKTLYSKREFNQREIREAFQESNLSEFRDERNKKIIHLAIEYKTQITYKLMDIINVGCKILSVAYSLKIEPYYSNSHPLFIASCSLVHSFISFVKQLIRASDYSKIKGENSEVKRINTLENLSRKKASVKNLYTDVFKEENNTNIMDDTKYFNNYLIDFEKDNSLVTSFVGQPDEFYSAVHRAKTWSLTTKILPKSIIKDF